MIEVKLRWYGRTGHASGGGDELAIALSWWRLDACDMSSRGRGCLDLRRCSEGSWSHWARPAGASTPNALTCWRYRCRGVCGASTSCAWTLGLIFVVRVLLGVSKCFFLAVMSVKLPAFFSMKPRAYISKPFPVFLCCWWQLVPMLADQFGNLGV